MKSYQIGHKPLQIIFPNIK